MPTDIQIAKIKVKDRIRKDNGSVAALAESIREVGLLHPIVLNKRRELVAGGRRLEAVKSLGWETVPVTIIATLNDAILAFKAEGDENEHRKPLTPSEMVQRGRKLEELEKPAAEERQREHGGTTHGKPKVTSGNFPEVTGETRDKVGEALGVSGKTYEAAKSVVDTGVPSLVDAVDKGEVSISAAAEVAKLPKEEQEKIVAEGPKAVKEAAKAARESKAKDEDMEPRDELDVLLKQILKLVKKNKELAKPASEELLSLADEVVDLVPPLKRGESRPIYPKVPFGHFHLNDKYTGPILKASDVGGEVVIDAYGHPVKPGLGDDFADARYLNIAILLRRGLDAFTEADKIYQKLSARPKGVPTFPTDDWNKITKGIVAVSNGLADWTNTACPFVQCRKCHGVGKGCLDCSGTGYWGKATAALYPTLTQDIRPKAGGAA